MERLQKYMAECGVASRRKCEELITGGFVKVNGNIISTLGTKINPNTDIITVHNKIISKKKNRYIILYKPFGYITTAKDQYNRPTVMDLIKGKVSERVYPVGRLDYATEGILLLTNDGELSQKLTHPKFSFKKTYSVIINGMLKGDDIKKLKSGIDLEDGKTLPADVNVISKEKDKSIVEITITEGRNRQVRRMFEALGYGVFSLKRIKYGPLSLKGLKKGEYRDLTREEVESLKKNTEK